MISTLRQASAAHGWRLHKGLLVAVVAAAVLLGWTAARALVTQVAFTAAGSAGTASSITLAVPAGTRVGDVLVSAVTQATAGTLTPPAGWALVQAGDGRTDPHLLVYTRVVRAAEPASYTWKSSVDDEIAGGMAAFRGVDLATPVAASAIQGNPSSDSATAPSVSPASAGSVLLSIWATQDASISPPAGMTSSFVISAGRGTAGINLRAAFQALPTAGASGTRVAKLSGVRPSHAVSIALQAATYRISGTVFEDVNYGGGAGRSLAAAAGRAVVGATVELYDNTGVYVSRSSTAANGSYSFAALPSGTYQVRVVSGSVLSSRSGSVAGLHGVMTFRNFNRAASVVAVTDQVGGTNPSLTDPGAGAAGVRLNTTTGVFTAGLVGTAQAFSTITLASADIAGINFGFNFNTVVNKQNAGQGSLRQAVANANTLGGDSSLAVSGRLARIEHLIFMLADGRARPGLRAAYASQFSAGVASIPATSGTFNITQPLVLDARTQPGWVAAPIIEINGNGSPAGSHGVALAAGGSSLRGLVINRWPGHGVALAGSGASQVQGNWIGLAASGSAASPNAGNGLDISSANNRVEGNVLSGNGGSGIHVSGNNNRIENNLIGSNAAGSAGVPNGVGIRAADSGTLVIINNTISGNSSAGLHFDPGNSGVLIQANRIGRNASNSAGLGNGGPGISVLSSACCPGLLSSSIGGTAPGQGNVIAHNTAQGVVLHSGGAAQAAVLGNSIHSNAGIGIDLDNNGVSANDGATTPGQPNQRLDSPVFTSARARGNQLTVVGYVGSAPGQNTFANLRVEVFVSDRDSSGFGQGRSYLGFVSTDASGNFNTTFTMGVSSLPAGTVLTATATHNTGYSSEFGANFNALLVDWVVNHNADAVDRNPGDGVCETAVLGQCTLRAALQELNTAATQTSTPTISFNIPGCTTGAQAACVISPPSNLPAAAKTVLLDASTQPGYSGAPMIEINGSGHSGSVPTALELGIGSGSSSVRGFRFTGWAAADAFALHLFNSNGHNVEANWFGLNAAGVGSAAAKNRIGVAVRSSSNNRIGGLLASQRNIMANASWTAVYLYGGSGSLIQGNTIGGDPAGNAVTGSLWIGIANYQNNTVIGGAAPGAGNLMFGATSAQIFISTNSGATPTASATVQGNRLGMNASGTAIAAGDDAIRINGAVQNTLIGGTLAGQGNSITGSLGAGIGVDAAAGARITIQGNSVSGNAGLGIDLGRDGVNPNDGVLNGQQSNNGIDHPVLSEAGVSPAGGALTVSGYIGTGGGTGGGQAVFAGARIELFKAAADASGFGEGQVYLGFLIADAAGRFKGNITFSAGLLAVGDSITATATHGAGDTSEFGPNTVSTTEAALSPAGFNSFETDTPAANLSGVLRSKTAGQAATLAVVALNNAGTALHAGFSGAVSLRWLDARDDSAALVGSCRASWADLGPAGTANFSNNNRVNVSLTPAANSTRSMRLSMRFTGPSGAVVACSNDNFAGLPASLLLLAASDSDAATAGTTRTLANLAPSGGTVHRAGRPFTLRAQALDQNGNVMTAYDGSPLPSIVACVLPAGCSPGALAGASLAAAAGLWTHNSLSYAEVGAIELQLTDSDYAAVDASDTALAARTLISNNQAVGRFVPDSYSLANTTSGVLATANAACLASGAGATFMGQGFGWAVPPALTVTAHNAAGAVTTLWTGALMKLQAGAVTPLLSVADSGTASLAASYSATAVLDLGAGRARITAGSSDRFVLDTPAGSPQASLNPSWSWSLSVADHSEATQAGNPSWLANSSAGAALFDQGGRFHNARLSLSPGHGDARSGVLLLAQMQRFGAAGWVTLTEDRGCVTVGPQHLGVEAPSGIFSSAGVCAAPLAGAVSTAGGRAWLRLPATPGAAAGRLNLRLAGAAATGNSCNGANTQAVTPLPMPWLLGGASSSGPVATATWGRTNRDTVWRREAW